MLNETVMNPVSYTFKGIYEASLIGVDPIIDKYPLMSSPIPMLAILISYLAFVKKIGPKFMANRQPFQLKNILLVYNVFQVILCCYIVSMMNRVDSPLSWLFSFGCKFQPNRDRHVAEVVFCGAYWYFIAKLFDLFDTVFFVLRKKSTQISFLHIYHHSLTFASAWYYLKYMILEVESGVFIGLLNSMVHVLMYTYYGLSALGPQYRKYLWWKKYITCIQLIQFFSMIAYMTVMIFFSCRVDRFLTYFFFANCCLFVYLFSDFYRRTYHPMTNKPVAENNIKQE